MAMQHVPRKRAPRAHEAATLASPTLHVILGGRRQLLSNGQRRATSSQSSAPAGYRAGPAGVGYPAAEASSAAFTLPKSINIGTGDFTIIAHFHVYAPLTTQYNYIFGSNLNYFTLSSSQSAVSGSAALTIGASPVAIGSACNAVGEYRIVVRRIDGNVTCWINGVSSTVSIPTSVGTLTNLCLNTYQAGQGLGVANTTIYLVGLDTTAWSDGQVAAFLGNPSSIFTSTSRDGYFLRSTVGGSIAITDIAQVFGRPRVFEGAAGSASVSLSGTQAGGVDDVQVQIELASGGVVVPWTTIATAVADGGAWSGSITVPRGGWYVAKARRASTTGTVATQSQQWGVGYVLGMFGQSHLVGFGTGGTLTPDDRAGGMCVWDSNTWINPTTAGAGRNTFVSALVAKAGCPVACIIHAVSGTSLSMWWQGAKTTAWTQWAAKVTEAGGDLSGFVLWQGEGNLGYDDKASYIAKANEIFAQLRTDYGANLPVTIGMLGRHTGTASTDPEYTAIREAHVALSNQANCNGFPTYDQALADGTHFNEYAPNANRMAQCVAYHYGDASYGSGPVLLSATRVAPTLVDLNVQHFGGTDFTPATGITGFTAYDNGTPITISSAVRQAANKIRLTLASTPTGTLTVRYGYGMAPDITGAPHDNSGLALPLITTDADLTAAGRKVVLNCIQRVGGAPAASVTGLRWAFFDQSAPNALTAPVVTGTGESTDGSGVLEIDVIGTSLEIGATGYLVTDTAAGVGFAGPVVVSG